MKILFSPQVSDKDIIMYNFEEGVIHATLNGKKDTFDFRDFGDGVLEITDLETNEELIETELEHQPIISARRENGILYIELLNFIGFDATHEECFPEWIDHTEYKSPKKYEKDKVAESDDMKGWDDF